jgi:hypothetical protein
MTSPACPTADLDRRLAAVDAGRLAGSVAALADAPFTGRRVGTDGGAAARDWLGAQLKLRGADVSTAAFPVRAVPDVYQAPNVNWHDGTQARHLTFGRQVAVHPASADLAPARRGDIAIAGEGAPEGRWIVVPAGMSLFDGYGHADGAAGLLIGRAVDADGWHFTMLAGPDAGRLPILMIDPATHRTMLDAAGRGHAWLSGNAPIRRVDATAMNVHGRWGSSSDRDVRVLLAGHFDGVGDHPGLRQPAASDNATGVAIVLEAARVLGSAFARAAGLGVTLLDAEEVGALGSAEHARQLRHSDGNPLVVNVDGAGRLDRAAGVEAGGPAHGLLAILDQAGRHVGLPLTAGPVASDNRRYAAAGLATLGIGAGMAGYHSPADTADRVDPATMTLVCRLIVATAHLIATRNNNLSPLIGD